MTKKAMEYKIGQKIYYRGDMANQPGWFEIVAIVNNGYCKGYDLKEIDGERIFKSIYENMIYDIDKGNGLTRFVTEEAYKAYREQQLKALQERLLN